MGVVGRRQGAARAHHEPGVGFFAHDQPRRRDVAFVSQRNGDTAPQLYLLSLAGGEPASLTDVPTGVAQPKWFPDGKRIAFLSRVWSDLDTMTSTPCG